MSQFYDKSCLNEQIRMQARFNQLEASQLDIKQMQGLEYELWYFTHEPSLYVIRKQMRRSTQRTDLLAVYYIVQGTIYQSPVLHSLLSNRVLTALHHTRSAIELASHGYDFHPMKGYEWKQNSNKKLNPVAEESKDTLVKHHRSIVEYRQQLDLLLFDTFKPPS